MDNKDWERVLSYVDDHIFEKTGLKELAGIAGYSPFYFSRIFAEEMGMPVTGYIRIRKLQYSIVSLLEGAKVLDVAMLYAFDSHEGFTRAFSRLFGSTPGTVKKYLTSYEVPAYVVPTISNRRIFRMTDDTVSLQNNLHQLVFEVLKETIEEAREGFCTEVAIIILADGGIKIRDNGRGIPLSEDPHASREVLNKILAGKPVTNAEYSQMGDLVQSGMQTVNSLCESLQVTVTRNGRRYRQDFVRGIAQHELQALSSDGARGTEIIAKPDSEIFGKTQFSEEIIRLWIEKNASEITGFQYKIQQEV